jgi:hypothetical protein
MNALFPHPFRPKAGKGFSITVLAIQALPPYESQCPTFREKSLLQAKGHSAMCYLLLQILIPLHNLLFLFFLLNLQVVVFYILPRIYRITMKDGLQKVYILTVTFLFET